MEVYKLLIHSEAVHYYGIPARKITCSVPAETWLDIEMARFSFSLEDIRKSPFIQFNGNVLRCLQYVFEVVDKNPTVDGPQTYITRLVAEDLNARGEYILFDQEKYVAP